MTPMLISLLAFVAVAAVVGALAFVFRGNNTDTSMRLDILVGKRRKEDAAATDILRKTAFDADKKSLLELITPKMLSLEKYFQQAECHIKPSTLIAIGLGLGVVGGTLSWMARVPIFLAPLAGLCLFT